MNHFLFVNFGRVGNYEINTKILIVHEQTNGVLNRLKQYTVEKWWKAVDGYSINSFWVALVNDKFSIYEWKNILKYTLLCKAAKKHFWGRAKYKSVF